jgi:hypothetical protein
MMTLYFINIGALELLLLLPFLAWLVLIIVAFVKCLQNPNLTPLQKVVWALAIWFFPMLGSLAYLAFAPNPRSRQDSVHPHYQR